MSTEIIASDIANDLFIMNKYTVDKLFASTNPADCFALYGFYYKTAKWQKTNSIKANDKYVKLCLKWGDDRVRKAKEELKELGLIQIIQRRSEGKVEGWYIQVSYLVSEAKEKIVIENLDSNNPQKQEVAKATSGFQETNALKQKVKCLKTKEEMLTDLIEEDKKEMLNLKSLSEWFEFKKYNYKKVGVTKLVNMLSKYSFEIQREIIDTSIMNGYQGLFEPKQQKQFNKPMSVRERSNQMIDEVCAELERNSKCDFEGEIYEC